MEVVLRGMVKVTGGAGHVHMPFLVMKKTVPCLVPGAIN